MIQLQWLSGSAGEPSTLIRRWPWSIGRGGSCQTRIEAPGVWEQHAELSFRPSDGFYLARCGEASVYVNGALAESRRLRPGDVIDLGGARFLFWLSPAKQRGLHTREFLTWLAWGALGLVQVAAVYGLSR
jgi:predicted component of type VI protein secretion system